MKKRLALLVAALFVVSLVPVYGFVFDHDATEYTKDGIMVLSLTSTPPSITPPSIPPPRYTHTRTYTPSSRTTTTTRPEQERRDTTGLISITVGGVPVNIRLASTQVSIGMSSSLVNDIIDATEGNRVVFDLSGIEELDHVTSVRLPRLALERFGEENLSVEIRLPGFNVVVDATAASSIASRAGSGVVSISVIQPVGQQYRLRVSSGIHTIHSFDGNVNVTIN